MGQEALKDFLGGVSQRVVVVVQFCSPTLRASVWNVLLVRLVFSCDEDFVVCESHEVPFQEFGCQMGGLS